MTPDELKTMVALAALPYVSALEQPAGGLVIGVGTGSTVDRFIDQLVDIRERIAGAVSSSERSSERLRRLGFRLIDSNEVTRLPLYVDGADEIDPRGCMIKGGGAALTREKIVADLADRFLCIADSSKLVATLGRFPLPIEVLPMATAQVMRHLSALGGRPVLREGVVTDNGGSIIDVHGLSIDEPAALECEINQWPGVVSVGIFARHRASMCLLGRDDGVQTLTF